MKWSKYTIKTTTEAEELIGSALADLGIEGVQIEDNIPLSAEEQEKLFIDILPELPPDDGTAYVSFYVEETKGGAAGVKGDSDGGAHGAEPDLAEESLLSQVRQAIEALRDFVAVGAGTISRSETMDQDWLNNWKQYFHAFAIDDIWIKPTWEELPASGDFCCVIEIDPGTTFGTGKHETTRLCIRQLRAYLTPQASVLDVGCGSGILSIVSLKLGAGQVNGTDVDEACMEAVRENMQVNGLSERMGQYYVGDLTGDLALQEQVGRACYDVVVANILADIIIPMAPALAGALKTGGVCITSGIIDFKEESVKQALQTAGLTIEAVTRDGEWVSVTARKG